LEMLFPPNINNFIRSSLGTIQIFIQTIVDG
jgi:hypothetical protein